MSAFEGSAKSQLQGVSQQVARERLDGQVTAQDNMLSDVVTGLRRRPGAQKMMAANLTAGSSDTLLGFDSDVGGVSARIVINTASGILSVFDEDWTLLQALPANTYLQTTDRKKIRTTTVGDEFIIANLGIKPTVSGVQTTVKNPDKTGFFYIKTGAFERAYTINISTVSTGEVWSFSYTTPAANVAGAAASATPEAIAGNLASQANTYFTNNGTPIGIVTLGAYVYLVINSGTRNQLKVYTDAPTSYIGVSNLSYVALESDLPAKLHPVANGLMCATGSLRTPTYFMYDTNKSAWLEVGNYTSPGALTNMPIRLSRNATTGVWSYASDYEGRYAGDDTSNPLPNFLTRGITGLGAFQGRMVILSGSLVDMSGSARPTRWFRSSVTSVLADDPIEVGSSANSSAAYQYCVPFQKDLLLFSEKYQALVPGGNQAITPSTASVIITSTYEGDMTCSPIGLGRTLVFPAPRSQDFYGVMEMVPSQYTDSQYLSSDVTSHLPKYLAGRCRFAVSSSVANIAVFASTSDKRTLVVNEYLWDGDNKVQQAWHRWTFPYDIADAFFSGSAISLLFVNNGTLVVGQVDPRVGTLTAQADRRPFMDLYVDGTVVGNQLTIDAGLLALDPNIGQTLRLSNKDMALLGEEVGLDARAATSVTTVPSFSDGAVTQGIPYRSSFSPTNPMVKDSNGVVISSNKLSILRYMIGTANTSEYEAIVSDASTDASNDDVSMSALYWGSADLNLGNPRVNTESTAILPCRTAAATTTLLLFTEGLGEMNILSLEYVCRYNQKLTRR